VSKNVIWWIGVKNPDLSEKYDGFGYYEYSKKTWQHFCKRFDCEFVEFSEPVEKDMFKFRINWQKAIFVFDELERRNIDYDQICLVDAINRFPTALSSVIACTCKSAMHLI